MVERKKRNNIT